MKKATATTTTKGRGKAAKIVEAEEEEEKEEEKEEGMFPEPRAKLCDTDQQLIVLFHREGRVRRGYGFRTFRLSHFRFFLCVLTMHGSVFRPSVQYLLGLAASIE